MYFVNVRALFFGTTWETEGSRYLVYRNIRTDYAWAGLPVKQTLPCDIIGILCKAFSVSVSTLIDFDSNEVKDVAVMRSIIQSQ
jgi:hypothetical protein